MIAMDKMQLTIMDVIEMVAVLNTGVGGIAAAMAMPGVIDPRDEPFRGGIGAADRQNMFIGMLSVDGMQVPVMQIIEVAVMRQGNMAAIDSVQVIMIVMHDFMSLGSSSGQEHAGSEKNSHQ